MSNKKQTSVEYLKNKLKNNYGCPDYCRITWIDLDKLIEQAKEIHKQEIMDAYQALWDL